MSTPASRRHVLVLAGAILSVSTLSQNYHAAASGQAPSAAQRVRLSAAELAKRASPSVVTITTAAGVGSGVILDAAGVIVTNLHVVRGQSKVSVKLANGDIYDDVSVVDVDERKDLVLLKIKAFGLSPAIIGNSDQVRSGDRVVLIGSPRGLDLTISDGLISAIRDSGEGYRLFQTSAAASPGSSGGGMFNEFGELIGISSEKLPSGENLNFGIPVNYVRGLVSTVARTTLAELAARFPASGTSQPSGAAATAATADPASQTRFAALLANSQLEFTKANGSFWTTSFKGNNVQVVNVYVGLVGDLVVTQSFDVSGKALTPSQLEKLLALSFNMDLVKVSINKDQVVALNETEFRLLDGPGLKRIVEAVALCEDQVAGNLAASPSATPAPSPSSPAGSPTPGFLILLQGRATLRYVPTLWKEQASNEPDIFQFQHTAGDLYIKVISERTEIPLQSMPAIMLANVKSGGGVDSRITQQEYRTVNGLRMLYIEYEATFSGIPASLFGYCFSGVDGTVQILGFTGRNLLNAESRKLVTGFASGFAINR